MRRWKTVAAVAATFMVVAIFVASVSAERPYTYQPINPASLDPVEAVATYESPVAITKPSIRVVDLLQPAPTRAAMAGRAIASTAKSVRKAPKVVRHPSVVRKPKAKPHKRVAPKPKPIVVVHKPKSKPAPKPVVTTGTPSVSAAKAYALSKIGSTQYSCLYKLFNRESHWNPLARNSSSGAYGIPQALPGSKMAWAGDDWRTNPITQVRWGLHYISGRYGTACGAWRHSENYGWY